MVRFVSALLATAVVAHYEKPPCASDEMQGQLTGGGELCAPKCDASGSCPTDVPSGVTASPVCALQDQSGNKYCGLLCTSDSQCDTANNGKCSSVGFGQGVCTYAATANNSIRTPMELNAEHAAMFNEFKKKFNKFYDSVEEEGKRFAQFIENVARAAAYQAQDPDAQYGAMTPFGDMHPDEFALKHKGLNTQNVDEMERETVEVKDLPASFDWRTQGGVNPVQNQAQCGSCWAFSTVANIESVNWKATGQLLKLSEQQLVDCENAKQGGQDQGCQGGLPTNAFTWMKAKNVGLELESDYQYTARDDTCSQTQAKEKVFVDGYKTISTDEDQIAQAVVDNGVLSIGINAGPMQFYMGGIANPLSLLCNPKKLDHGVDIVGFGSDPKPYWIIRNSWGAAWGEKGYYRIVRGKGKCGLNTMVTTAVINKKEETLV